MNSARLVEIDGKPGASLAMTQGQSVGLAFLVKRLTWRERLTGRIKPTTLRLIVEKFCIQEGAPHVHLQIAQPDPEKHLRGTRAAL